MVLLGMWSWDGIFVYGEDVLLSVMCLGSMVCLGICCFLTTMIVRVLMRVAFVEDVSGVLYWY